jgi:ribosomal protein S18 acetylase RimI-like enzyme
MSAVHIRASGEGDLAVMQEIERAAGSWFPEIGMAEIAEDEPLPLEELARYRQDNLAWIAVDDGDVPAAYLIAGIVDGCVHIEQVSVHPRAARRGIGRMLLEHAAVGRRPRASARSRWPPSLRCRGTPVLCALRVPRPG